MSSKVVVHSLTELHLPIRSRAGQGTDCQAIPTSNVLSTTTLEPTNNTMENRRRIHRNIDFAPAAMQRKISKGTHLPNHGLKPQSAPRLHTKPSTGYLEMLFRTEIRECTIGPKVLCTTEIPHIQ